MYAKRNNRAWVNGQVSYAEADYMKTLCDQNTLGTHLHQPLHLEQQ